MNGDGIEWERVETTHNGIDFDDDTIRIRFDLNASQYTCAVTSHELRFTIEHESTYDLESVYDVLMALLDPVAPRVSYALSMFRSTQYLLHKIQTNG